MGLVSEAPAATRVSVLIDSDARALDGRAFTYLAPAHLAPMIRVGTPALVPFGAQAALGALVIDANPPPPSPGVRLREIEDVLSDEPLFDAEDLEFWRWIAAYYGAPLASVIACALPAGLLGKIRREVVLVPQVVPEGAAATLTADAARLLRFMQARDKAFTLRYLSSQLKMPPNALNRCVKSLRDLGWLRVQTRIGDGPTRARPIRRVTLQASLDPDMRQKAEISQTPRDRALIQLAQAGGALWKKDLQAQAGVSDAQLAAMARSGQIRIDALPPMAALLSAEALETTAPVTLNADQRHAVEIIARAPESAEPWLLYGVTGSGKTEVYIELCAQILSQGCSALILVPEIALTSQIAQRFLRRFGWESLIVWHSDLAEGERLDGWARLRRGDCRLAIGARSAMFLPMRDLGLIILDEAHDASFKQESPAPRYHALTLAQERARRCGATVVLGSATPDVAHYWRAQRQKRLLRLPSRAAGRALAQAQALDMRVEPLARKGGVVSLALRDALAQALSRGEQALILMNRRGFHTLIQCGGCGHVFQCPSCAVSLTAHENGRVTRCHHCGYQGLSPQYCPHCASMAVIQRGAGTQRVTAELAALFPQARLLRLDSDVMSRRREAQVILARFAAGDADVLVGTQMVAKGLDIPNVTLVGVIQADSAFSLPDYRACERGFQLLTQVCGRAGRGDKAGLALLQTLTPEHPAIQLAQAQDYEAFFEHELAVRQAYGFPPFSQLFRLIISGEDEGAVQRYAEAMAAHLKSRSLAGESPEDAVTLLGPAPCVISRIQDRVRYHLLLKSRNGQAAHEALTRFFLELTPPEPLSLILDVDAQSLL